MTTIAVAMTMTMASVTMATMWRLLSRSSGCEMTLVTVEELATVPVGLVAR